MIPARTLRSLDVLRTLSGKSSQPVAPHAAYMKITSLELEKLRLNKAKEYALRRLREIDARLHELDQEKAALLEGINFERSKPMRSAAPLIGGAAKGLHRAASGKFRFTY